MTPTQDVLSKTEKEASVLTTPHQNIAPPPPPERTNEKEKEKVEKEKGSGRYQMLNNLLIIS